LIKGRLKSQEEFYLRLHARLILRDPLELSSSVKFLQRDILTITSRCRAEGLAFLTKSLPLLGKALDQALVSGRLNVPRGFRLAKGANRPVFMQAYFSLVFDEDGLLLEDAQPLAIRHLRQVLFFAYKLELPYSKSQTSEVISKFVRIDAELELVNNASTDDLLSLVSIITQKVFKGFNPKDILPRHGPGAVATGERLEYKWKFSRLYDRIHQFYPYYNYYVAGGARELTDRLDWYRTLQRLESGVAKVVLVPKDSRGPRLISCEPLEYQWIQQGLGRKLAGFLEYGNPYTQGAINFTRQDINRNLAKISSANQRLVTLDLSDASDRVSVRAVERAFSACPELLRALLASRTTATKLPDGRVITLNKFAPMGSALCFPVEAYLFWAVIVAAVIIGKKLPLQRVARRVMVYGDDIIVPTEWASLSIQGLEGIGLKVNPTKSCITGFFRESCGLDAFKGIEVTPSRLSTPWRNKNIDGSVLLSYSSLANLLAEKGYSEASDFIWEELERLFGVIPYGTSRAPYPCKVIGSPSYASFLNRKLFKRRINRNYQIEEFLVLKVPPRYRKTILDGWTRMLRNFVSPPFDEPSIVVVPRSTKIKRGWARVA